MRILALTCCLAFSAAAPLHAQLPPITGHATIVDGDTIDIGRQRVRLHGIDAPEANSRCWRAGHYWQCGADATAALKKIIGTGRVTCAPTYCDPYHRFVATCRVDGKDISELMVREGLAIDWPRYSDGHYAAAQGEARAAHRGLWAEGVRMPAPMAQRMQPDDRKVRHYACPAQ
jgi:endonuclease YncB( thermonuclease family)